MPSYQKYLPGAYWTNQVSVGSIASHSNSTHVVMRAPHKGTLLAAYFTPEASINSEATNARTYSIINGGAIGNGTTVLASYKATASKEAFTPMSFTTQANCSFSAGDVIEFQTASCSTNNKQTQPACLQLDWRFER